MLNNPFKEFKDLSLMFTIIFKKIEDGFNRCCYITVDPMKTSSLCSVWKKQTTSVFRPDIKQDYPPNLSILISGGKENN